MTKYIFECEGRNDELRVQILSKDLELTKLRIIDETRETIEKMRRDRGISARITRLLLKLGKDMGIEEFINLMNEAIEVIPVYNTVIKKTKTGIAVQLDVNDMYFDIVKNIPIAGFLAQFFSSKKKFVDEFEKSLVKEYGYKIIMRKEVKE